MNNSLTKVKSFKLEGIIASHIENRWILPNKKETSCDEKISSGVDNHVIQELISTPIYCLHKHHTPKRKKNKCIKTSPMLANECTVTFVFVKILLQARDVRLIIRLRPKVVYF
ncbi:Uncharacterized protein TCM_016809 [Theobroma cacao]|uniref:Uncharacterized protein n=1 Tax=Theobroma cacao TaxID=3641 RepID=A0A061ECD1_THECC|nr:Uncharacterized protein TCM_016809 [Theobroma cacao]